MNDQSFTLLQAADIIGKSGDTVRRYYRKGRFPGAGPLPSDMSGTIYIPRQALLDSGLVPAGALAEGEAETVLACKAAERDRDAAHDELLTLRLEKAGLHRELGRQLEENDRLHKLLTAALKSRAV